MITLSENDKFIIENIVDFIANNPKKEQTNKKLIIAFVEHLVNMTYPPKESQGIPSICKLTKTLAFPFEDRQTKQRVFLCVKCRSLHSQGQVSPITEVMENENQSQSSGNIEEDDADL